MPIDGGALLDAAVLLAKQEQWRLTMGYTTSTAVLNVLSGMVGSGLLGPPGVLIGVGISAAGSYLYTRRKYKPIFVILKEDLEPRQQEELKHLLHEAFKNVTIEDGIALVQLLMDKRELLVRMKEVVMTYLMKTFTQQMVKQSSSPQYVACGREDCAVTDFSSMNRMRPPGALYDQPFAPHKGLSVGRKKDRQQDCESQSDFQMQK